MIERADEQHLVGELGARSDEGSECAGGGQFVGAAEIGDHPLAHGRPFALVLDNLHIAAVAGFLEAEEHGPSRASTTEEARLLFKSGQAGAIDHNFASATSTFSRRGSAISR